MNAPAGGPVGSMLDAHVHIWSPAEFEYRWLDSAPARLRAEFTLEDAARAAAGRRVVLVQALDDVEETRWLIEQSADDHRVAGVVGWVDVRADPLAELSRLDQSVKLLGVRVNLRTPQVTGALNELGPDLLSELGRRRLALELLADPSAYPVVDRLIEGSTPIVIDHAWAPPSSAERRTVWMQALRRIAPRPHVFVKWSGRWLRYPAETRELIADALFEHVGPDRLLYGSDWPVTALTAEQATWALEVLNGAAGLSPSVDASRAYPRLIPTLESSSI